MAIGPIDYTSLQTQLDVSPLLQLGQVRQQKRAVDAEMAQRQQQAALVATKEQERQSEQDAYWLGVEGVMADPTTEGFQNLLLRFPDKATAIKQAADQQTGAQKTRNVQAAMTLGGLVNNGMNDRALQFLTERKGALAENGESTEVTDDLIDALKKGDTNRVKGLAGMVIAGTLGDGAGDVLETLGWGPKAQERAADNARADAIAAETARHNRVSEGQGASRIGLSAAAGARAAAKGGGRGAGGRKVPSGFVLD